MTRPDDPGKADPADVMRGLREQALTFATGGGVIGAGEHESVRGAANRFISLANTHLNELTVAESHPLPTPARIRFYGRTFSGIRTTDADEEDLGYGRHVLSPLFQAGHAVIAAIRELHPRG